MAEAVVVDIIMMALVILWTAVTKHHTATAKAIITIVKEATRWMALVALIVRHIASSSLIMKVAIN